MRTLEEIRKEMADSASYYEYAKQAGVQSAMDRHEAVYGALAWVLEEPWKASGEFEPEKSEQAPEKTLKTQFESLTNHDTVQIETSIWSDDTVTYRHRVRTNWKTTDWSEWVDGDRWYV